jgi:hypothetical protein
MMHKQVQNKYILLAAEPDSDCHKSRRYVCTVYVYGFGFKNYGVWAFNMIDRTGLPLVLAKPDRRIGSCVHEFTDTEYRTLVYSSPRGG